MRWRLREIRDKALLLSPAYRLAYVMKEGTC